MKTTKIGNSDQDLTPPPQNGKRKKKGKKVTHPTVKKEIPSSGIRKYTHFIISTGK